MNLSLLPYTPERDVYRLLQIDPNADAGEVVAACRRLARTFHPDMNASPRATQEMQVVNAVRLLLTDPVQRSAYDGARRRFLADRRLRATAVARSAQRVRRARGPQLLLGMGVRQAARVVATARAAAAGLRQTSGEAWSAVAAVAGRRYCPRCASPVEREHRFCADCGTKLLVAAPE